MNPARIRLREAIPVTAVALGIAALGFILNRAFYHDDAYIGLRYVRNMLQGSGLVWNEGERVQGYTNFLHLILIGFLGLLRVDLVVASRIVNGTAFALLSAILFAEWWSPGRVTGAISGQHGIRGDLAGARNPSPARFGAIPAVIVATSFPLIVWTLGGLEGPLFTLFVTAGVLLTMRVLRDPSGVRAAVAGGFAFALASLTRPDGLLFAAASFVFLLARGRQHGRRVALLFALSAGLPIAVYLVWQVAYYSDFFPNTFYAKGTGWNTDRLVFGLRYLRDFVAAAPYTFLLLIPGLAYAAVRRKFAPEIGYLISTIVVYGAYVLWLGGDHMACHRLFLPLIPCAGLLLGLIGETAWNGSEDDPHPTGRMRWIRGAAIAFVLALCALQILSPRLNPRSLDPAARVGTTVGKYIAAAWPEGSLIALNTAGSTPYFAPRNRYVDMLGLNDRKIAKRKIDRIEISSQKLPGHAKGDGAYVLSRSPDYIIIGPAQGTIIRKPWFLSDWEISLDPRFQGNYGMEQVRLNPDGTKSDSPEGILFTYYRRIR